MSWIIAFVGFAALIVLHELGHFAAAKAVGMRVERFSLFFGPMVAKFTRGETTYGIGTVPLGGYVKISGMDPREEIPAEHAHRAYFRQPVWKRIVVIAAGPAVNVVLALGILWAVLLGTEELRPSTTVERVQAGSPASQALRPRDRIVAVDGRRGAPGELLERIASHGCEGRDRPGCVAAEPARVTVSRSGREATFAISPKFTRTDDGAPRPLIGVVLRTERLGQRDALGALGASLDFMRQTTAGTWRAITRIFDAQQREQLSGVVGSYEATRRSVEISARQTFYVLGALSFALGIINLLPLLPLDGGHIFWALAEKLRRRRISIVVMERASVVGFALIAVLFFIGLQNDVWRIQNGLLGTGS